MIAPDPAPAWQRGRAALCAAFVAGIIAATCLPHAGFGTLVYDFTPASFLPYGLAVTILFLLVTAPGIRRPQVFARAFLWQLGYFTFGLNWVGNALLVPDNDYAWAWPLAFFGLPMILAPFVGLLLCLLSPLLRVGTLTSRVIIFTLCFTVAEWVRGHLFTGFPWILPGMIWGETLPVFQILSLTNIYGLSALTILWATSIGLVMLRQLSLKSALMTFTITSFALTGFYGYDRLKSPPPLTNDTLQIVMVQPSLPQTGKWDENQVRNYFDAHLAHSARPENLREQPTLIVWAETAIPPMFITSPVIQSLIRELLATYPAGSMLITGAMRTDYVGRDLRYFNSVIAFDDQGTAHILYDKHHLVPFGEYIPLQRYIPLKPVAQFTGLQAGPGRRTITLPGFPAFSPLVCYEILFSDKIVAPGAPSPRFILNLTNDAWFGATSGPRQHLLEARARAIEEDLPVIRVASTGISATIDKYGRVLAQIPYNQSGQQTVILSFW